RARGRITLTEYASAVCIDLQALDFLHRRIVDAGEDDMRVVRRPPVASVAAHLLLSYEFGDAVLDEAAAVRGDGALLACAQIDHEQILISNEADVAAAGRELGIGLVRLTAGEARHRLGLRVQIVQIQIAAERNEQALAVAGELVLDDAAQRSRALPFAPGFLFGRQLLVIADQLSRIDQHAGRAATGI